MDITNLRIDRLGAVLKCLLLAAFLCAVGSQPGMAEEPQRAAGKAASVQAQTVKVLFIGNSRLYHGDIPKLFGAIVKAAKVPARYDTTLHGVPNGQLEDHVSSPELARLLERKWDIIVIQPAGGENLGGLARLSFKENGAKLIEQAKKAGKRVVLLSTWPYSEAGYSDYLDIPPGDKAALKAARDEHVAKIVADFKELAQKTGVDYFDLTTPWAALENRKPDLALYDDETHPAAKGSYFAALAMFVYLERNPAPKTLYIPRGIDDVDLTVMRDVLSEGLEGQVAARPQSIGQKMGTGFLR